MASTCELQMRRSRCPELLTHESSQLSLNLACLERLFRGESGEKESWAYYLVLVEEMRNVNLLETIIK